jgi:ABC-type transport system substrate-binding protein
VGRTETDRAKRKQAYDMVQQILAVDETRIFLFYPPSNFVRRDSLLGLPANSTYYYLENAYFK